MIANDELRRIVILGYLTDKMLEKLIPIVERTHVNEREYIFRQGNMAEKFFMRGDFATKKTDGEAVVSDTSDLGSLAPHGESPVQQNVTLEAECHRKF